MSDEPIRDFTKGRPRLRGRLTKSHYVDRAKAFLQKLGDVTAEGERIVVEDPDLFEAAALELINDGSTPQRVVDVCKILLLAVAKKRRGDLY